MTYSQLQREEAMLLSLDAQKAFDCVSWQFLFQTLLRLNFGPNFLKLIKTLYSNPQASVIVNSSRSQAFSLERGCRQGCSLSPLLFAICIEPLAQLIRDDKNIKGITIGKEEHKLSLYADDVLLYLSDPTTTISHLKKTIDKFGYYSGYTINIDKTEAMDISCRISQLVKSQSGFKWPKGGIKYLGIMIPQALQKLYSLNYDKIIKSIKNDLERWASLPISFIGQIESVHMNVLPKMLYLFQMLPVKIPKNTFNLLNRLIARFIWQGKKPRIKLKTLQLSKSNGGAGTAKL